MVTTIASACSGNSMQPNPNGGASAQYTAPGTLATSLPALTSSDKLISNGGTLKSFADAQNSRFRLTLISSDSSIPRLAEPKESCW